jgi:hypothetical protein
VKKDYTNIENIKRYSYELYGNEYTIIGDLCKNSKSKIEILHNVCNKSWSPEIGSFLNSGRRCNNCYGTKKMNIEIVKNRCNSIFGNEYDILSTEYSNNKSIIDIKHTVCGHIYKVSIQNLLNLKSRCGKCYGTKKLTFEDIQTKCNERLDYKLICIGSYSNNKSKILVEHNCGFKWEVSYTNFLRQNCPSCTISNGELQIEKFLKDNNIRFIREYKFEECRNKRCLRFDFYLPCYNTCIEYDGIQHFESIEIFGGDDRLKYQNLNDEIKNNFCILNNIRLIRLKYSEIKNIEIILNEIFEKI